MATYKKLWVSNQYDEKGELYLNWIKHLLPSAVCTSIRYVGSSFVSLCAAWIKPTALDQATT